MCGIAAIFAYDTSATPVNPGELRNIRDFMASRGPDGAGEWFSPDGRVALGHRRLAIIDTTDASAQPMGIEGKAESRKQKAESRGGSELASSISHLRSPTSDFGPLTSGCWIVFNGEIYNFRELRAELEQKGHRFTSAGDTEVLLRLYIEYGEGMLDKLRGMYAFAIWDGARRSLFLARDPFGIKPLYYADDGKTIRVASQVKALVAGGAVDTAPEPAGHVGFFLWGHVPTPYTFYRGIRSLVAGRSMTIRSDGLKNIRTFCSVSSILAAAEHPVPTSDLRSPISNLRSALVDSVRHHLIADVPTGVFLSAGLDSTTIAALAAEQGGELRTLTLGFEEYKGTVNDEVPLAEELARQLRARHQTVWVTRKDFENELPFLLDAMDQPSADGVNSYFISKAAAQAGLKVALSGLGGDELFGSYPSFQQIPRMVSALHLFRRPAFRQVGRGLRVVSAAAIKRLTSPKYAGLFEYGSDYGSAYLLRRGMFMPWELPGILDPVLVREGWRELQTLVCLDDIVRNIRTPHLKISALEMSWYMRHQLLRDTDWASMAHSLEIRVPFVDISVLRKLGPVLASSERPTKRDMAQTPSSPLPSSILNRRKTGFTVPVRDWLLRAFDPSAGAERGLRGWTREVYSIYTDNLDMHRAAIRRRRAKGKGQRAKGDGESTLASPLPLAPSPSAVCELPSPISHLPSPRANARRLRVLALVSDAFGGFGGISKFNRDFLTSLCSHPDIAEVVALPRVMPHDAGPLPEKLVWDTSGLGGKVRYIKAALRIALGKSEGEEKGERRSKIEDGNRLAEVRSQRSEVEGQKREEGSLKNEGGTILSPISYLPSPIPGFDLIICGHIHLLPIAVAVQKILARQAKAELKSEVRGQPSARRSPISHLLSPAAAPAAPCPLHLIVHGVDAWAPTASAMANHFVRYVDGFISVSNVTKRRFMRWSKLRDDQGVVLPNCVDLSAFGPGSKSEALLERYGLHGKKVLMTLGRLASEERYKGFDEVLEILPDLARVIPDIAYMVCGDGPDRPRLVAKAKSLGLDVYEYGQSAKGEEQSVPASRLPLGPLPLLPAAPRVVFTGRIPESEKADHYRLADVYVMPSSGEGFGIVYLEALACGVPVIGSSADGSREALMNGKLGQLVDPRDRDEIISAIVRELGKGEKAESRNQKAEIARDGREKMEVGSAPSRISHLPSTADSALAAVSHFSAEQFERRLHRIIDCITEGVGAGRGERK